MQNIKFKRIFSILFILIFLLSSIAYASDEVINTAPTVQLNSRKLPKKTIDIIVPTDYTGNNLNSITSSLNVLKSELYSRNCDVKYTVVDDTDTIKNCEKVNARGYTVDMFCSGLGPGWSDWIYNDAKIVNGLAYVRIGYWYNNSGQLATATNYASFNVIKEIKGAIQVRYLAKQTVAVLDNNGRLYRVSYSAADSTNYNTNSSNYNIVTINLSNLYSKEKIVKIAVTQGNIMALTNKGRVFVENNGTLSILKNFDGSIIKVKDISDSMVLDFDGNIYFHGYHLYYPYLSSPLGPNDDPSINKYFDFDKLSANADILLESQFYKYGYKHDDAENCLYKTKTGSIGMVSIYSDTFNSPNGTAYLKDINFPSTIFTACYTDEIVSEGGYYYFKGKDGGIKQVNNTSFAITSIPGYVKFYCPFSSLKDYIMGSYYQPRPYILKEEDAYFPEYMEADMPVSHVGPTIIDEQAVKNVPLSNNADRYIIYVSDGTGNDFTKPFGQYYDLGNLNKQLGNYLHGNDFTIYAVTDSANSSYKLSENPNQDLSLNDLCTYSNNDCKLFDKGQFQQAIDAIASRYNSKSSSRVTSKNVNVLMLSDYTGYKEQSLIHSMNEIKEQAALNNNNITFSLINDKVSSSRVGNINYNIWNTTDNKEATNFYDIANYSYNYISSDNNTDNNYSRNYKFYEKFSSPKTINNLSDVCMVTYDLETDKYALKKCTYALRVDGTVYQFDSNNQYKKVDNLNYIVQIISTQPGSLYALDKNGRIYLYGYDALALNRVGTVTSKADTFYQRPTYIYDLTNIKDIQPIYNYGYLMLYNDGHAVIYGDKYTISATKITERDSDGTRYSYWKYVQPTDNCPYNLNTILGASSLLQVKTINLSSGNTVIYALTGDKKVLKWNYYTNPGIESTKDCSINVLTQNANIKKMAVDKDNIILLLNDGTALGEGNNVYGQLANNGSSLGSFTQINGISNIKDVMLNSYGSYFLTNTNELWRSGALYNSGGYWTDYTDKTLVPVKEMSNVKLFSATKNRITVVNSSDMLYQKGYIPVSDTSGIKTNYYSYYVSRGSVKNATNLFDSDAFTLITCSDGLNYAIGDTGSLFGACPVITHVNRLDGYKIVFQIGNSLYLAPISNTNKCYAYGDASTGLYNYYTKRVEYASPIDITDNILNGLTLDTGEKLIWFGLNWVQSVSSYSPFCYEKMFFLTNKRCIRQVTNNTYISNETKYDSYYGYQNVQVTKFIQSSYLLYSPNGSITQTTSDTDSIDLVNSLYTKTINAIYNEYNISFVDIDKVLSSSVNPSDDNYFIYISDGKGNDFSRAFGNYYSFGNLNTNLKQYLINNNFSINAINPIDNFEYKLPQLSDIQELNIRELVKGSVLKGKLFSNTLLDEGLVKIFHQYTEEAISNIITILKDEDVVDYITSYKDFENDPLNNVRWYYEHNPNFYENSNGKASFADTWLDKPVLRFSNKGEYIVTYGAQDQPKDNINFSNYNLWSTDSKQLIIRVNERPIADFIYIYNSGNLSYIDLSYDKDHESMSNKGIAEWVWEWKLSNDTDWKIGQLTSIDTSKQYQVRLTVKDIDGAWSYPVVKTINTNVPEITINPMSQYWINHDINVNVTINDKSTGGLKYSKYVVTQSPTMPSSGCAIRNYAANTATDTFTYTIHDEGKWYIHVLAVNNFDGAATKSGGLYMLDKTPPTITLNKYNGSIVPSENISVRTDDNLSGVRETWFKWSTSNGVISDLTGFTKLASTNITSPNTDGTYYLHMKCYDVANNVRYMIYGPYSISSLTLAATLSPNPAKQGQRIGFTINTTGFAKYLTIYFPNEIWNLDPSTPIYKTIPEQPSRCDLIYYYLPLKTPLTLDKNGLRLRTAYPIQVKAEKADGTSKKVNLTLDVKGNIYDGVETEIK